MKSLKLFPAVVALVLFAFGARAQETTEVQSARLSDQISAYLGSFHTRDMFGGSALVAEDGAVLYQGAFGLANEDWDIANSVDTRFRLASVTKQFTAMLVLLLVEEDKLELDAPVTRYLPDYPSDIGDRVTVHHLLNHTSGLPNYTDRPRFRDNGSMRHLPVAEFVAEYCSDPLEFEPGSEFRYSNSGYYLLGALVEAVTDQTYSDALRERIFEPLGMNDTGYDDQYAVIRKRATGYNAVLGGRRVAHWIDMSVPFAAGALYSTVGDLWKWDRALASQRLLAGELEKQMFSPGMADYGYGWFIDNEHPGGARHWHSGGIFGFSTRIVRIPEQGRCIILLGNTSSSALGDMSRGILQILDGETPEAPSLRGDRAVATTVLAHGIERGLEQLAPLLELVSPARVERDINDLGYQILAQGRKADAILLFEFLTQAFPESANTWDSLGEAHLRAGHRQLAAENYRKALELDPTSATAKPALEKLRDLDSGSL